jgi:hypothetical protein
VPRAKYAPRQTRAAARVVSGTRAVPDCTQTFVRVLDWLGGEGRNPSDAAEKRADALLVANRGILRDFGVNAAVARRHNEPGLVLQTSTRIGAIPLLSPVSGRPDFGLVVEPRFSWSSAGEMLAATGFKVVPELLPLPELPQSERRVPPWVLSSIVLPRLRRLLKAMQRRFVITEDDLRAPRGAVRWDTYVSQRVPHGRALDVPCRYPDLRNDEELRSAIHWVTRRHRESLLSQAAAGMVVRQLLLLCDELLALLAGSSPRVPGPNLRTRWHRIPISTKVFREGLQAIDWTLDERGLAGLSDLAGLSWCMDMEVFFEAWAETIVEHAARRTACRVRAGRREETRVPLDWQPRASGSQRSLLPDVVMERDDVVVVLDAKYKRHAEQIERLGWHDVDQQVREEHRGDVLQALAYSTLFEAPRIVACLAYPAGPDAWHRLVQRGRHVSRARVRSGRRRVELALMAIPLSGDIAGAAKEVEQLVREAV